MEQLRRQRVAEQLEKAGVKNVVGIRFVSAKTGFGVSSLLSVCYSDPVTFLRHSNSVHVTDHQHLV
jgi:hypothetical protein